MLQIIHSSRPADRARNARPKLRGVNDEKGLPAAPFLYLLTTQSI